MAYRVYDVVLRILARSDPEEWDWVTLTGEKHVKTLDSKRVQGVGVYEEAEDVYDIEDFDGYDSAFTASSKADDDDFILKENADDYADHENCHDECVSNEDDDYHPYGCPTPDEPEYKPNTLGDWLEHKDWCIVTSDAACGCGLNAALNALNIGGVITYG